MKKYFALFLDGEKYIEKCISLIRYINNPSIQSFPHITVRFIYESITGNNYLRKARVGYLNLIKPNVFENKNGSYTIFLQCESDDLEELEYKYDYPFSRLHITLYEGTNKDYAYKLLKLLNSINWKVKLSFEPEKHLTENTVGSKKDNPTFFSSIENYWNEIIDDFNFDLFDGKNQILNLSLIKKILEKLKQYFIYHDSIINVESNYNDSYSPQKTNLILENDDIYKINDKHKIRSDFITPPEYAKEMAEFALQYFDPKTEIHFGDSSIGTGNLFFALKRAVERSEEKYNIKSAIGIDISETMVRESFSKYNKRGLDIIYGDALLIDYSSIKQRNLMLVNPPYNRHEYFTDHYLSLVKKIAERNLNISLSKDADIFVYHLLIVDQWLQHNGIAVWLLPSSFLYTNYAKSIRKYLTEKVTLLKIHIYDDEIKQFDKTYINTSLIVFKKATPLKDNLVEISSSKLKNNQEFTYQKVDLDFLMQHIDNWRTALFKKDINYAQHNIFFSDLFEIKRGLATGANSFFVLTREQAYDYGIPDFALKPILPKARYLKTTTIDCDANGFPILNQSLVLIDSDLEEDKIKKAYPAFYNYLEKAKEKDKFGISIIERTLVRTRKPWYKQEYRAPAPFLLTYMGRPKKDNAPSLYFIRNKSKAVALNTYILLYPKKWLQELLDKDSKLYDELFDSLKESAELISSQTRIYSGNLQKLEPGSLKKLPILKLPTTIIDKFKKGSS